MHIPSCRCCSCRCQCQCHSAVQKRPDDYLFCTTNWCYCFLHLVSGFAHSSVVVTAGMALGSITERGRGTILHFDVETLYINVALGLLTTVSALRTFGVHRTVFYREASSGLNKYALVTHNLNFGFLCCLCHIRHALLLIPLYSCFLSNANLTQRCS